MRSIIYQTFNLARYRESQSKAKIQQNMNMRENASICSDLNLTFFCYSIGTYTTYFHFSLMYDDMSKPHVHTRVYIIFSSILFS